jgi:hypothetical protein
VELQSNIFYKLNIKNNPRPKPIKKISNNKPNDQIKDIIYKSARQNNTNAVNVQDKKTLINPILKEEYDVILTKEN